MSSSSYAPNESDSDIVREEQWLNGAFLDSFFLGIQTTLCVLAFIAVLRRTIKHNRMRIILLVYIAVLLSVTVTSCALSLYRIQTAFITQRNYPGGPSVFLSAEWSIPFSFIPLTFNVFANWMMESLLVWRCRVVCSTGERLSGLGFAIPLLLLIAIFVISTMLLYHAVHTPASVTFLLAYGFTSLALNLIATGFIAGQLLIHRYRIVKQLGRAHGQHYVSIATVVIESAAVYTVFIVINLIVDSINSPALILLQEIIVQIQAIASIFIIWQIARGKAWTRSTDTEVVSAAVSSSLNSCTRPLPQANVIQLEALSTRRDEVEEEGESNASFHKSGEV